jgi:hypothetical protein
MNVQEKLAAWSKRNEETGCLEWTRAKSSAGYGQLRHQGKTVYAHRMSYEIETGENICGLMLCHKCDNPGCIEPTHLFPGTQALNMADCAIKGRTARNFGSKSGKAKLTEEKAIAICIARNAGESAVDIGKRFNIDASVVSRIARGKAWPHIRSIVRLHEKGVI